MTTPNFHFRPTAKGLLRAEFKDRFGALCALQESSRSDEDSVWFGIEVDLDGNEVRYGKMLLTQEMAKALVPLLRHFARTGRLGLENQDPYHIGTWVRGVGDYQGIDGRVVAIVGNVVTIQDHTGVHHDALRDVVDLYWDPQPEPPVLISRYDMVLEDD